LIVATLTVFPADFDAGTVYYNHFTLRPIWGPDDHLMESESLCFFGVHKRVSSYRHRIRAYPDDLLAEVLTLQ